MPRCKGQGQRQARSRSSRQLEGPQRHDHQLWVASSGVVVELGRRGLAGRVKHTGCDEHSAPQNIMCNGDERAKVDLLWTVHALEGPCGDPSARRHHAAVADPLLKLIDAPSADAQRAARPLRRRALRGGRSLREHSATAPRHAEAIVTARMSQSLQNALPPSRWPLSTSKEAHEHPR